MTNSQRWPLYIDGKRYIVEATVYAPRPTDSPVLFARVDKQIVAANKPVPPAGMELEIKVGARTLWIRVNPAKGHLLSLIL